MLNYAWLDVETWTRSDAVRYLIIVADQLVQGGDSLAWWRNLTGMRAQVVSRSDIGGGNPAGYNQIRAYIQDAYDNWPEPPEFVGVEYVAEHTEDDRFGWEGLEEFTKGMIGLLGEYERIPGDLWAVGD